MYIDINALAQGINSILASQVYRSFKALLGLEPMAPIRPQLLVSHANHSATETSLYICMYDYVYMYVCIHKHIHTPRGARCYKHGARLACDLIHSSHTNL